MSANERWTTEVSEEEARPRGSATCLDRAVERLGPFKFKLQADADVADQSGGHGRERPLRKPVSEETACHCVVFLAYTYNRQVRLNQSAPRTRDVVEALTKLENLSGELSRYLLSLDDFTRQRLQSAGSGIPGSISMPVELMFEADAAGLPAPSGRPSEQTDAGSWVKRLDALSQFANFTRGHFLRFKGIKDPDAPDKGGNTNLYKNMYGSPRWALVQLGWFEYDQFKPGTATGTEGGLFHLFLMDVFEFATGLDPEQHSKLVPALKRVAKANRRMEELTQSEIALIAEQGKITSRDSGLPATEKKDRLAEVGCKLREIIRERDALWSDLLPYSFPQTKHRRIL